MPDGVRKKRSRFRVATIPRSRYPRGKKYVRLSNTPRTLLVASERRSWDPSRRTFRRGSVSCRGSHIGRVAVGDSPRDIIFFRAVVTFHRARASERSGVLPCNSDLFANAKPFAIFPPEHRSPSGRLRDSLAAHRRFMPPLETICATILFPRGKRKNSRDAGIVPFLPTTSVGDANRSRDGSRLLARVIDMEMSSARFHHVFENVF